MGCCDSKGDKKSEFAPTKQKAGASKKPGSKKDKKSIPANKDGALANGKTMKGKSGGDVFLGKKEPGKVAKDKLFKPLDIRIIPPIVDLPSFASESPSEWTVEVGALRLNEDSVRGREAGGRAVLGKKVGTGSS